MRRAVRGQHGRGVELGPVDRGGRPGVCGGRARRSMKNAAALRKMRWWQFGARSEDPEAAGKDASGAMLYAGKPSAEMGFVRR